MKKFFQADTNDPATEVVLEGNVRTTKKRVPWDANIETPIPGTGYSFKVLSSSEDLGRAFFLRFMVFCIEKKVANPLLYPNHLETDEYDKASIHTAITEDGEIIAYTRLVMPSPSFPIERSASLPSNLFVREKSVETSRALVVQKHRHSDVIWHLFNSIYALAQTNNIGNILSFSNAVMFNGYKKRGVPFSHVGDPILFHGHKSYPLIIRVDQGRHDFTKKERTSMH